MNTMFGLRVAAAAVVGGAANGSVAPSAPAMDTNSRRPIGRVRPTLFPITGIGNPVTPVLLQ